MDFEALESLEAHGRVLADGPPLTATLCGRCRNGLVYRRGTKAEVVVHCEAIGRSVPSDITECSRFRDVKSLSLYEMSDLALRIDARPAVNDRAYA